jgi:hypothetical protein
MLFNFTLYKYDNVLKQKHTDRNYIDGCKNRKNKYML